MPPAVLAVPLLTVVRSLRWHLAQRGSLHAPVGGLISLVDVGHECLVDFLDLKYAKGIGRVDDNDGGCGSR